MVEVTIKNFAQQVEVFEEKLKNCSFLSMSAKISGLNVDETTFPDYLDSTELRYEKMRKVASTFNIVQMGMCLFQKEEDGSFIGTPFSFYLFPPASSGLMRLQMDIPTAHQLKQSGLDFNKWAYDGIPFLPDDQYMQRREMIIEHTTNKDDPEWQKRQMKLETSEEKEMMATAMSGLDAWVKTFGTAGTAIQVEQSPGQALACYAGVAATGTGREFVLPECNPYIEKAIFLEIQDRYPFLTLEKRSIDGSPKRIVASFPLTESGQIDIDSKVKAARLAVLDQESTFRRVYAGLIEAKKPIVGHNFLYDLVFLCRHCESVLPESYKFWKKSVHRRFPHLYDTKTLASLTGDYADTTLAPLYTSIMAREAGTGAGPQVLVDASIGGLYPRPDGPLDAGVNAWMAGAIFVCIGAHRLIGLSESAARNLNPHWHANAMFCCRTFFTVNMVGDDRLQPGVLHLSGFSRRTTNSDLLRVVGIPDRIPMRVRRVPPRVKDSEVKKYFLNIGPIAAAVVVPAADGVSDGTGFVVFQDPKHLLAALQSAAADKAAAAAAETAGGQVQVDSDMMDCEAVKIGQLRWISPEEAFLILPGCTDDEAMAVVGLSEHSVCKAVPLGEYLSRVRAVSLQRGGGGGGARRLGGGRAGAKGKARGEGLSGEMEGMMELEDGGEEEEGLEGGEGGQGMSMQERGRKGAVGKKTQGGGKAAEGMLEEGEMLEAKGQERGRKASPAPRGKRQVKKRAADDEEHGEEAKEKHGRQKTHQKPVQPRGVKHLDVEEREEGDVEGGDKDAGRRGPVHVQSPGRKPQGRQGGHHLQQGGHHQQQGGHHQQQGGHHQQQGGLHQQRQEEKGEEAGVEEMDTGGGKGGGETKRKQKGGGGGGKAGGATKATVQERGRKGAAAKSSRQGQGRVRAR